jgi:NADPH-dependent 2,4-dienoyl-CoA reductase/sulfur reductase-like enzyme
MSARSVVIVGAGLAGLRAAEMIRSEGFDGTLTIVGAEDHLPYDRPPLSKDVLIGKLEPEQAILRSAQHFADLDVEVRCSTAASSLDIASSRLQIGSEAVRYDELIICTGSRPRRLAGFPSLAGVRELRTIEDARAIRRDFERGAKVVVVGAGFIGAEVASSARQVGLDVAVVEIQAAPLIRAVGPQVAPAFSALHRDNGTDLRCGVAIARVEGTARVERLQLSDGSSLECDLLIVGLGTQPNVEWLADSGLMIADGVVCDENLCAGPPNVHAAGDVAWWVNPQTGQGTRGQQWMNAVEQSRYVARRILGRSAHFPFAGSNYFWSDQYGVRIQFVGSTDADRVEVVSGSLDADSFLALYRNRDRLVGALAKDQPIGLMKAKTMLEQQSEWDTALEALAN